jgi:hypothetical protein
VALTNFRKKKARKGEASVTDALLVAGRVAGSLIGPAIRFSAARSARKLKMSTELIPQTTIQKAEPQPEPLAGRTPRRRLVVLAGTTATLSAAAMLAASAAFGLFKVTTISQSSTFQSGTVTLASDISGQCPVNSSTQDLFPGSAPAACTMTATYSGTVHAYLALDVLIETQAGNGGTKLYSPTDSANDLQVAITSVNPTVTYTVPTSITSCPVSAPGGSTCYEIDNELVSQSVFTSSSPTVTFSTSVSLPSGTTTGYRGGSAQIMLTAHAVQSSNNGSTSSCTVGHECDTTSPGAGAPNWK